MAIRATLRKIIGSITQRLWPAENLQFFFSIRICVQNRIRIQISLVSYQHAESPHVPSLQIWSQSVHFLLRYNVFKFQQCQNGFLDPVPGRVPRCATDSGRTELRRKKNGTYVKELSFSYLHVKFGSNSMKIKVRMNFWIIIMILWFFGHNFRIRISTWIRVVPKFRECL